MTPAEIARGLAFVGLLAVALGGVSGVIVALFALYGFPKQEARDGQ